ncbi:TPA: transporter [Yersinia enterocolitica]|nr:transporter [Yersinia enterocolitica]HDL6985191.1 transporter [Yersinia enterocolitica]HDL7067733.1 transporter [Yersinia enterocolitica]HDL7072121.1 transporter [Yersinia enterocolitica]
MNSQLMIFNSADLGISLSGMLYKGKPVFFAVEAAEALGYAQPAKAVNNHCKSLIRLDCAETEQLGLGFRPKGIILGKEQDLYRLIMRSKLPSAERVQDWVCEEVLPSIRTTGSYSLTPSNDLPDFTDEVAAARAWADAKESERKAVGYVHRQAKYILHLENLFKAGMTPSQFCKQLNGVNVQQVTAFLEDHNWLYDERPESRRPAWRVKAYARDLYLTERRHLVEPDEHESFDAFTPVLLRKGAIWIYRYYLKGSLPMKKNWNGQFTHDKELAGAA